MSLAEAGLEVLVLDRLPSVGQGSNKRAIGGLRATHSDPAKIRICLRSLEVFSTWEERFGDKIEWHKGGYSYVAYRAEEERTLKELLAVQKTCGLNIDWLDAAALLGVIPDLNPDGLVGGTFSPDDGNASPLLAVHAFYSRAKKLGAEFRFDERVTGDPRRRRPRPRRPHGQGRVRGAGRRQRGRALGRRGRGPGRDRRPGPAGFARGRP